MELNKVDDKTAYENLLIKYAELENKIADIKANCDLAIEGRDIKIKELEDHLAEEVELHLHAEEYNKSLEEENNKYLDVISNYEVKVADLEKENEELKAKLNFSTQYYLGEKAKDQLTKAKEIIKDLMSFSVQLCDCRHTVDFEKTREQAVQFLKETEK